MKGKVARVNSTNGFGFIKAEDGKEYFFHRSAVRSGGTFDMIGGGEEVEIEDYGMGPKGLRAETVHLK